MKTAKELYELSKNKTPEKVKKVLDGVREHVIMRCEEEANKGATYYSIYLDKDLVYIKDMLLKECITLAKEFEDAGYKVSIEDNGNGYYINFIIRFSWNGKVPPLYKGFGHCELLYTTDKGIVYKGEE